MFLCALLFCLTQNIFRVRLYWVMVPFFFLNIVANSWCKVMTRVGENVLFQDKVNVKSFIIN